MPLYASIVLTLTFRFRNDSTEEGCVRSVLSNTLYLSIYLSIHMSY